MALYFGILSVELTKTHSFRLFCPLGSVIYFIFITDISNFFLFLFLFLKVFDGDKRPSTTSMMRRNTSSQKRGDVARRLASEQGSRGMLNFSIQYKQAT